MKTNNKPATSNLVARFDKQLRDILIEDLKAVKQCKNIFFNMVTPIALSAA
jgi:hypothetical protein